MRWHHAAMNLPSPNQTWARWAPLCLACVLLSSCAGQTAGEHLADMPHWMGGEPAGVPPRRGTPEYDAWMAARAQEAARPKTDQPKIDQPKTDQPKTDQPKANRPKTDQPKARSIQGRSTRHNRSVLIVPAHHRPGWFGRHLAGAAAIARIFVSS